MMAPAHRRWAENKKSNPWTWTLGIKEVMVALIGPENVREAGWDELADVLKMVLYIYTDAPGRILTVVVFWVCSTLSSCVPYPTHI